MGTVKLHTMSQLLPYPRKLLCTCLLSLPCLFDQKQAKHSPNINTVRSVTVVKNFNTNNPQKAIYLGLLPNSCSCLGPKVSNNKHNSDLNTTVSRNKKCICQTTAESKLQQAMQGEQQQPDTDRHVNKRRAVALGYLLLRFIQ